MHLRNQYTSVYHQRNNFLNRLLFFIQTILFINIIVTLFKVFFRLKSMFIFQKKCLKNIIKINRTITETINSRYAYTTTVFYLLFDHNLEKYKTLSE